jgi:hypothetical protein
MVVMVALASMVRVGLTASVLLSQGLMAAPVVTVVTVVTVAQSAVQVVQVVLVVSAVLVVRVVTALMGVTRLTSVLHKMAVSEVQAVLVV